jgi:hypothetical protein
LTEPHQKLYDLLPKNNKSKAPSPMTATTNFRKDKKNILLLGSGLVSKPFVDYLRKRKDLSLTIGKLHDMGGKKVLYFVRN